MLNKMTLKINRKFENIEMYVHGVSYKITKSTKTSGIYRKCEKPLLCSGSTGIIENYV